MASRRELQRYRSEKKEEIGSRRGFPRLIDFWNNFNTLRINGDIIF
jgi:hypothetical protein